MFDLKNTTTQRQAMQAFFFGYQAFTAKADEMLSRRGLSRVHQRILFFIAGSPGLCHKDLLQRLGVTKQALNMPLRQLVEMDMVIIGSAIEDKRKRSLNLTRTGAEYEQLLRREQVKLLERAFSEAGEVAVNGWFAINRALAGKSEPLSEPSS
ncbi:DNA-binding MarR family transcriptional regulator [Pseudomonas duriflava]|uniref:DNA-binding MarR family transcriptional regulator n=1 Tax=Pseudomonas duriflava TaxID=459528 RepID=A0A562Q7X0_9PSED|nr:MarR family winged helix-turn-helix transcriptional regulator [Pseudomonas duriflava]TWI52794.1 DNA-binding MarR family transcriptional regulator [Pseudomonas duriflava]